MSKELSGRQSARLLFDIFLIIVALIFIINSLDLDFRPGLFPRSFCIILLLMATIQTLMDWSQVRKTSGSVPDLAKAREKASGEEKKAAVEGQYARLGIAVLSILLFYIIFRFVTIYLAIPVLCLLLLRYLGGRSWRTTGILALGMDAFIYVFFQLLLQTSL